jgi:hypothetical protein
MTVDPAKHAGGSLTQIAKTCKEDLYDPVHMGLRSLRTTICYLCVFRVATEENVTPIELDGYVGCHDFYVQYSRWNHNLQGKGAVRETVILCLEFLSKPITGKTFKSVYVLKLCLLVYFPQILTNSPVSVNEYNLYQASY